MKHILTIFTISILFLSACKKDDDQPAQLKGQTTLTFNAKVGREDFALNKEFIINGDKYSFIQVRYWVSNVVLTNDKGVSYKVPNAYFLLEENNTIDIQDGSFQYPARKRKEVVLPDIPAGNYKSISFGIGVDSVFNNNLSLQAGELKGTRINGKNSTSIAIETGLNTNYRTLKMDLPASVNINAAQATTISFDVDIAKIIDGLDLIETPVIGAAQKIQMTMVADNYGNKVVQLKATVAK
jgi:hypothetical protein